MRRRISEEGTRWKMNDVSCTCKTLERLLYPAPLHRVVVIAVVEDLVPGFSTIFARDSFDSAFISRDV